MKVTINIHVQVCIEKINFHNNLEIWIFYHITIIYGDNVKDFLIILIILLLN